MKQSFIYPLCICVLTLASCYPEYDFRMLDTTIAIGQGMDIPTGVNDTVSIKLREILKMEQSDLIQEDSDGFLYLDMDMKPQESHISVQSFKLDAIKPGFEDISLSVPMIPAPIAFSLIQDGIVRADFSTEENHIRFTQENLPGDISEISYLKGEAVFTINFKAPKLVNIKGFTLAKDSFAIILPQWLVDVRSLSKAFAVDGNKVVICSDSDFYVPSEGQFSVSMMLSGVDFSKFDGDSCKFVPGKVGAMDGKLIVNDKITTTGQVILKESDITAYPVPEQSAVLVTTSSIGDFKIESACLKLRPNIQAVNLEPVTVDHTSLPAFLVAADAALDASGPFTLTLNADNKFPMTIDLSTKLLATSKNDNYPEVAMGFGTQFGKDALHFPSGATKLTLTREMHDTDNSASFLHAIPRTIGSSGLDISIPDELITVVPGSDYSFTFSCNFHSPLCFGPKMSLEYSYDLNLEEQGINIDLSTVQVGDASMSMEIISSIPFAVTSRAYPLDSHGNIIDGLKLDYENMAIAAGTLDSPSVNATSFGIWQEVEGAIEQLKAIRLSFMMSEGNGQQVNMEQGLTIHNISLHTDSGVIINSAK